MSKKINIEFISKIGKPKTENIYLNSLLNILTIILFPIIIILGLAFILVMLLLSFLQSLFSSKTENQPIIVSDVNQIELENQWRIFSSTKQIKLYQKIRGEVRFGPIYLNLKSEPSIEKLHGKIFGDWFYIYQNGIFLQQWNSTNDANTNLIFLNAESFEMEIIKQNIPSVLWKIKQTGNENLELICDTGNEILKYEIDTK